MQATIEYSVEEHGSHSVRNETTFEWRLFMIISSGGSVLNRQHVATFVNKEVAQQFQQYLESFKTTGDYFRDR